LLIPEETLAMKKLLTYGIIFLFASLTGNRIHAQGTCNNAAPFCTGTAYNFPAATNAGTAPAGPNYGCLGSQPNEVWYYAQISTPGNLQITLTNSNSVDVDFICWGPFANPTAPCLTGLTAGTIEDCSYSGAATEIIDITGALTGEYYIIMMTNYSNQPTNFTFSQTGGTATTNCAILCNITGMTAVPGACNSGTNTFNVTGTITTFAPPSNGTLTISSSCGGTPLVLNPPFGTSINYTLTGVPATGGACQVTASYSADPLCTFTTNITSPAPCNTTCTATASNTGAYCPGQTIQLNATGGGTYSWSGPGAYSATGASPTRAGATTAMSGIYTVTVTSTSGGTCTATTSVTVNAAPAATASNTGAYCAGQTIQLNGGGGGTYAWTGPGFTSALQNPTIASSTTANSGTYSVTVTVGTCTAQATTSVTVNANPVPTATNTGPYCVGQTIQLNGGGGGTYAWAGPGFTSALQNPTIASSTTANSGTYSVTVTVGTCTAMATTSVTVSANPVATATNTGPYCVGSTIQLNGGGGGTYSWTGPGFSSALQNPTIASSTTAMDGVYSLLVTVGSCTSTATTSVIVNNALTVVAGSNSPLCDGAALNLTCNAGTSWAWTGPSMYTSSTQNPTISPATSANSGTYNVTATDANGCTGTSSVTVTINPPIVLSFTSVDANCSGTCDGQVSVSASGGTPGYTYLWNSGCTTASCSNLCGGSYGVLVTDAANCSQAGASVINQATTLNASISGSANPSCAGLCDGSATAGATGGAGTYTYSWNTTPVQTTATATGLCAGTYICTISETSCSPSGVELVPNGDFSLGNVGFSSSYNYIPPPNIGEGEYWIATGAQVSTWNGGMTSNGDHTTGSGDFMLVNGSGTPNSSVWCQTISVSPNTTYLFSTWVSSLNNSMPAQLQFSINGSTVGAIFTAPLTSGTWSQFFTTWNSGANTTASICIINQNTSLGGNDFGLDDISFQACLSACPDTAVVTLTDPAPVVITASPADTVCDGTNYTVSVSGGPAGTIYTWNPGGAVGSSQTFLAGTSTTYTVVGVDGNNCSDTDYVSITVPPVIVLATGGFPATCSGVCDGQVVVLASPTTGGFAQYQYLWSNSGTNASESNMCAGVYNVTVTDAAGCFASASATVTEPAAVSASTSGVTAASCNQVCDGAATVTAAGGTLPYNYTWLPAAVGNNPTTLCAGAYVCTVTDANGCADTVNITISEPAAITVSAATVSTICIGQTANLSSTPGGGDGNYSYTWTGGTVPANTQNVSVTPVVTSVYTVSVTDGNNCLPAQATVTVTVSPPLSVIASVSDTICVGASSPMSAAASGGNGIYTYSWSPATIPATGSSVSGTPALTTNYIVTVTDGCGTPAATDTVVVIVNPLPAITITVTNASGCEPWTADFEVNAAPSIANCSWTFTDGQVAGNDTTPSVQFDSAGSYGASVVVTDVNGCVNSATSNNSVTVYPVPVADFTFSPQPTTELNPIIYFTDASTGVISNWLWQFNDPGDSTSVQQNPMFTFPGPGTFNVLLAVNTINNCTDTISHAVVIDPDFVLFVPNAFSPNGEGPNANETFFPKGIGVNVEKYEMWIYDRWGNLIFATKDWNEGWDGKVEGRSEVVQQDVYVWKIKLKTYNGVKKSYVGHVTVVK
jgi:gliding motility-associated-like protein